MENKNNFLDNMTEKLTAVLSPIGEKMMSIKFLAAISDAMQVVISILLIGSFALLITALDIGPWQSIVNGIPGLVPLCNTLNTFSSGLFALWTVATVSYCYSQKIELKEVLPTMIISIIAFFVITPLTAEGAIGLTWLGTQGTIAALIIGGIVPKCMKFLIDHKVNIRLPEVVPPFVAESFSVLVPAVIILAVLGICSQLVSGTAYGDIQNMIFSLISTPLSKIGLSLPGYVFVRLLTVCVLWCGIHANATFSAMVPLLVAAEAANATGAGNIITYQFFCITIPGGAGQLLLPAIIAAFFCKSKQLKAVGKAAILPACFSIGEPVLFGMPVMLNALLFVPMVLGTFLADVLSYLVIKIGLVGTTTGVFLPWTCPPLLNAALSFSTPVRAVIWNACLLVILFFVWYPFMKAYDRQCCEKEANN